MIIASAVYAGAGQLNIFIVALIGFLAAVMGDNIGYAMGYFGGRRLVLRFGRFVFITAERLDKAESRLQHDPPLFPLCRNRGGSADRCVILYDAGDRRSDLHTGPSEPSGVSSS